jgi:hypothetical protein
MSDGDTQGYLEDSSVFLCYVVRAGATHNTRGGVVRAGATHNTRGEACTAVSRICAASVLFQGRAIEIEISDNYARLVTLRRSK